MQPIAEKLHIDSLFVNYRSEKGVFQALSNISCHVERGKCLALVGESGSGKTTLAKATAGLILPSSGSISLTSGSGLYGTRNWHKKVQIIFQDPDSVFNPKRTIGWHVEESISLWHPEFSEVEKQNKIASLLEAVQLHEECLTKYSFELSGGQKQRASLVRSLLVEPEFLILDEPLASQDVSKRKSLLNLLKHIQKTFHLGYLYITHDLATLLKLADSVAVMYHGSIVEMKSTEELFSSPKHPYTQKLLSSRTKQLEEELLDRHDKNTLRADT